MKTNGTIALLIIFFLFGCSANTSILVSEAPGTSTSQDNNSHTKFEENELMGDWFDKETYSNYDPIELLKNIELDDFEYAVTSALVEDINGDHLPEIILDGADGWNYQIYYYSNGFIQQVGNLSAWTWSSGLWTSANGDLVLCAEAHTTGTAGVLQYRVYHWDGEQYTLDADLCRIPSQWDASGIPVSYNYFSSNTCIDLVETEYDALAGLYDTITQEEFDAKIASIGVLTRLQLQPQVYQPESNNKSLLEYLRTELDTWR